MDGRGVGPVAALEEGGESGYEGNSQGDRELWGERGPVTKKKKKQKAGLPRERVGAGNPHKRKNCVSLGRKYVTRGAKGDRGGNRWHTRGKERFL